MSQFRVRLTMGCTINALKELPSEFALKWTDLKVEFQCSVITSCLSHPAGFTGAGGALFLTALLFLSDLCR